MTTVEKAKAYDEAIKRAKEQYDIYSNPVLLEYIFPELKEKESEDEKIRKDLIKETKGSEVRMFETVTNDEFVAWLEKQGEIDKVSYEIAEKEKREFVGDGFIKCYADFQDFKEEKTYWLEYVGNDNYNVRSDNLLGKTYHITPCQLYTIFKKMTWLEKQGQQEKDILENAILDGNEDGLIAETIRCKNEKQSEQKSDKVEPKFKIGDWVMNKFGNVWHIDSFDKKNYQVSNGNEYNYFPISKQNEMHLWTIQDARDGDVFATKAGGIFIYKELLYDKPFAYCGVDKFGVFKDCNCGNGSDWTPYLSDVTPATKEQRDLLFTKMKEAGYEWDSDKKELKKVEQKVFVPNKNKKEENIKNCIGMILTDADEQRFKDYDTNLNECLEWLKRESQL